jgi:hypothetical protein
VGNGETVFLAPGNYTGTNNTNTTIRGNGSISSVIIDARQFSRMFDFM